MTALILIALAVAIAGVHHAGNKVADSMEAMADPENVSPPAMPGVGTWMALLFVVGVIAFVFASQ